MSVRIGIVLGLAALALIAPGPASAAKLPIVAVFEINDQSGTIDAKKLSQLSTYLAAQLAEGGVFTVVPTEQIRSALAARKADSYAACFDQACQIEIGRELAAEKVLHVQIVQVGTLCAVTGTLFDLRVSASERASTHKGSCDQDSLVTSLENVARGLKGGGAAPEKNIAGAQPSPPEKSGINDAVQVHFQLPDGGETWTLRGREKNAICNLPCTQEVPSMSGFYLQLEAGDANDVGRVRVPDTLGYAPAQKVRAIPRVGRGSTTLGIVGMVIGGASLLAATPYLIVNATDEESGGASKRVGPGAAWTVGSAVVLIGSVLFYAWSDDERLDTSLLP